MSAERVTFWYGCNVLRHGDIIHACLDILRAIGFEPSPVGGPDYCCGTVKDMNQTTAGGMATRTVGKLNDRGARVVAWCPSCHSHMHDFMEKGNERQFDMTYLVDLLHYLEGKEGYSLFAGERKKCSRLKERRALDGSPLVPATAVATQS